MNRDQFLRWVETDVIPHVASGTSIGLGNSYRTVLVATRLYLGVDAAPYLRVHVFTNPPDLLRSRSRPLPAVRPVNGHPARIKPGAKGKPYFGFEWDAPPDYASELRTVVACVKALAPIWLAKQGKCTLP